ncbi:hypothetical protein WJX77_006101 [Trebouxia sp. C0004]
MRSGFLLVLCLTLRSVVCTQDKLTCSERPLGEQCPWNLPAGTANVTPAECPSNLHLAGSSAAKGKPANSSGQTDTWVHKDVCGRLIVRFRDYKSAEGHKADLTNALAGAGDAWKWVDRQNAAASYPTDFALLEVADVDTATIKEHLSLWPGVKDVHPEQQVKRSLTWDSNNSDLSTHSDGQPAAHAEMVQKRPGRFQTRPTMHSNHDNATADVTIPWPDSQLSEETQRRLLLSQNSVTDRFEAQKLWDQGYNGAKVKVGVFDTGIRADHPHVKNIRERTNWTHEPTLEDGLGHGTFVAGVIGGSDGACPGFAPEVELYTFRVFTNDQVSYTSWFLDAFNYAMATGMNVVNLSIGGPDYLDQPFVEKVWEITSNGILMVSAIGNDGPLYGTLNNPADQNDVIGVGGVDYADQIASFSSRGMSTWELPIGYGRAKPDVVAYGRDVLGSRIQGGCRSLSGTSVASPVVAGAVCLLASVVPVANRWEVLNPASMKQALVEGSVPIPGIPMYEQGQGKLNLINSMSILQSYKPKASIVPKALDFTDCPYMWPFCTQPIYANALPLIFNATVLNAMALTGQFESPPVFKSSNAAGQYLSVKFEYSSVLWPWSGFLALFIRVLPEASSVEDIASGEVSFTIVSPPSPGSIVVRRSSVTVPITVHIIPTPPRAKRVLWDQFHSMRYPPAYIPRDSLDVRNDILDWHGDHPHTNYHNMYDALRAAGYFLEILGSPFTCFDARQYGALLMVDSEEEYYPEEISKLKDDVEKEGMGLIVFGEWYNVDTMIKMKFFDDNTRSWWTPVTGGANVPALNDLLSPFGIAFGDAILEGQVPLEPDKPYYASGANIVRFPAGGHLHGWQLADKATEGVSRSVGNLGGPGAIHAVLGLATHQSGRIAVYGDSNCLDSSHQRSSCYNLLTKLIQYTAEGGKDNFLLSMDTLLASPLGSDSDPLPTRRVDIDLTPVSLVLGTPMMCYPNSPEEFQLLHGKTGRSHSTAVGQSFRGDVVAAVQPNIQAELQDTLGQGTSISASAQGSTASDSLARGSQARIAMPGDVSTERKPGSLTNQQVPKNLTAADTASAKDAAGGLAHKAADVAGKVTAGTATGGAAGGAIAAIGGMDDAMPQAKLDDVKQESLIRVLVAG